ncbi:MAG: Ig-like domain-containing protein, partial [Rheinheimera sp.]
MRNIRQLLVAFLMSAVVACGGGGTLGESGTPSTPSYTISLALTDASGAASKDLSKSNPLKLKATVRATNGSAANKLVTFTINDAELASFNNGAGTAQTLADGTAEIGLLAGTKSGAGEVSASIDGGTPVRIAFTSAGDGGSGGEFVITMDVAAESGAASSEVSKASPLRITAVLKSAAGAVQPGKLIKFELNDPELASFSNQAGTAETNSQGIATIGLVVGTKSGAGLITAQLADNNAIKGTKTFTSKGDGAATNVKSIGSLVLYADKLSLGTGSADKVELTVLVRDIDNNLMKDVDVNFSADNDAELQVVSAKTAVNGTAKANLTTVSNPTLRTINLKATATVGETKTAELAVQVVGTAIEVTSPQAIVIGSTSTFNINVIDANGNGIPNTPMVLTSKLANTFNNPTPRTDASSGRANITYTGTNGGKDIITIAALGVVRTFEINVDFDEFGFVAPKADPIEVPLNVAKDLSVQWLSNKTPVAAKDVIFATTRGAIAVDAPGLSTNNSSVIKPTDSNGIATIFIRSAFAGFTNIAATSTGSAGAIGSSQQIEFVATMPDPTKGIEVQVFPTKVGPSEKSVVTAVVRDINNNPVKNQTISFSLDNSAGGKLNPATAITNSFGIATTEFEADANTPGAGTPADSTGLKVKAQLVSNSLVKGETTIVVGKRTLFYRFGTGNEIEKKEQTLYQKQFAIIVTDAAGNPVANQRLNVQVYPRRYSLGRWV